MSQVEAILALGSNIEPRGKTIQKALDLLSNEPSIELNRVSRFYETTPVSNIAQDDFINAVCQIQTTLEPLDLFNTMESIEKTLGKEKKEKDGPRIIDLDLLFFSDQKYRFDNLTIPHPRWKERLFVLIPLLDIKKEISLSTQNRQWIYNIESLIKNFEKFNNENVKIYENS